MSLDRELAEAISEADGRGRRGLRVRPGGRRHRPPAKSTPSAESDFFFLQLSDTHWGYSGVVQPGGRRDA